MIERIKRGIKNPRPFLMRTIRRCVKIMPEPLYLKCLFYLSQGYRLNLKNPRSFNEKLQWLKLNDRNPEYNLLVDKYEVKEYLKKIAADCVIPTIGVYKSFDEIDFSSLPEKFVLKTTHQSGGVIVCTDKTKFDIERARAITNKKLSSNLYYWGLEWPYKDVEPRIIIEEYIGDDNDLKDYKMMCFNGKVKCSFVCSNRQKALNVTFFDLEWKQMPFERHYPASTVPLEKPINYNRMIEISEIITKKMRFARIDFFEVKGKLYIGEITFFPGCGFEEFTPREWDYTLGSWIKL